MKDLKKTHLIIMVLHYYLRDCNPCHFYMARMRIVLQNSIDSGTIELFYEFIYFYKLTAVDRGC